MCKKKYTIIWLISVRILGTKYTYIPKGKYIELKQKPKSETRITPIVHSAVEKRCNRSFFKNITRLTKFKQVIYLIK